MPSSSVTFEALGTEWHIETMHEIPSRLLSSIYARIELFDKTYSRFRTDSLIMKISKEKGTYIFPNDAPYLMDFYDQLYEMTNGKVTPTIGSILEEAGYDAGYSFTRKPHKKLTLWPQVVTRIDHTLENREPIMLDFGAAGKGYMVDIIANLLEKEGIQDYVIDASGDIRHHGALLKSSRTATSRY
ncbi:MAG: FAD:protein FMN transferase [Candidatus Microsaccharimonas sp.]